ncbi:hypothetical protein Tco_1003567 [Tanacetum coccineum]|uniref:Uncharacterized protein n=1 Tax=Tanacetum coccineum TaxID=301880 RepID=A0ABQ5FAJ7_9ASTR
MPGSDFAKFNTIITSLKALDDGFSSKNYVRKFLRALHPKWRAKVTAIEESKNLTTLPLDKIIGNLKVYKELKPPIVEHERVCLCRKRNSRNSSRDKNDLCGDPNHLICECSKPPKNNDQRAFIGGAWSDNREDGMERTKDETCLVAQAPDEICLGINLEPDEWIKDSGCSKHMTGGELLNSELLNGELLNSELLNGELLNGELLNGELLNGELLNGELLNSELLNSELPNSDLSILLGQRVVKRSSVIWMRTQLLDYGFKYNRIPMYCDSKSAIDISCNRVQHSKTKHIDIWYHFIKEHVERGTVEIYFVGTEYQLADLFTKALPKERFEYLVHRIGMRCMTPTQLESLTKLSS